MKENVYLCTQACLYVHMCVCMYAYPGISYFSFEIKLFTAQVKKSLLQKWRNSYTWFSTEIILWLYRIYIYMAFNSDINCSWENN